MALTEKLIDIADAIRAMSGRSEKLTLDQMPAEIGMLQSLNFEVCGNPRPTAPKENTIWVDTDEPVTGWILSPAAPETADSGTVWIATGDAGAVSFNALKENCLRVYPLSAKQYRDGSWASCRAQSCQKGSWVDWWDGGVLFTPGNTWDAVTGGWVGDPNLKLDDRAYASAGEVTDSALVISISPSNRSENIVTASEIDLTGYSYLKFTVTNWGGSGTGNAFVYKKGTAAFAAKVSINADREYTLELPAGGGAYRIGFGISTSNVTRGFHVTEVRLMV